MPKIYGDEDSSDSEGLELADGTRVAKKTTGGACGGNSPSTGSSGVGGSRGKKRGWDNDGDQDDPNKCRKTGGENAPPKPIGPEKSHARRPQFTPQLTGTYRYSTSLT